MDVVPQLPPWWLDDAGTDEASPPLAGDTRLSLPEARAHVIRFCLPALGARP